MGMDVYGREPISEVGSYFRNNVWWWRPLWNYCITQYPELTEEVADNGHTNSGDGLDAKNAYELGKRLQEDIDSGIVAQYEKEYKEHIESLPFIDCTYCNGTGKRLWAPNSLGNDTDKDILSECNSCHGNGQVKEFASNYPFSVENVQEFSKFLVCSGGFNIW
jgi:hypothetical protein